MGGRGGSRRATGGRVVIRKSLVVCARDNCGNGGCDKEAKKEGATVDRWSREKEGAGEYTTTTFSRPKHDNATWPRKRNQNPPGRSGKLQFGPRREIRRDQRRDGPANLCILLVINWPPFCVAQLILLGPASRSFSATTLYLISISSISPYLPPPFQVTSNGQLRYPWFL